MKRLFVLSVIASVVWLVLRRMTDETGSAMRAKCAEMCDRMLERMPESFPPNRMMADLDYLKKQTDRILDELRVADATDPTLT